ncbi:MAG: peroxidase-related enzyme [Burkholderia gladioli]
MPAVPLSLAASSERGAPPLSRLAVPPLTGLPDDIRQLVDANGGDNWIRALAQNPDTARRFVGYFASLFGPGQQHLPLAERELIAVVVSSANGCGLCALHHTHALGDALGDHPKAKRIAADLHFAALSDREAALAELAGKITRSPREVGAADFDRLRALGLTEAAILEAVETASWFNHTNRIFISTGVQADARYFDGATPGSGRAAQ